MHGDFSRDTFDPAKYFSRVLMQQGRVLLDADWNEQVAILLHYLRTLAADLIGPFGGPEQHCGFQIISKGVLADPNLSDDLNQLKGKLGTNQLDRNFFIGKGRYYVDGLLCENDTHFLYAADGPRGWSPQPVAPEDAWPEGDATYLVYLHAWERHVTAIEDESIRETALRGPDTATRAKVSWQVKAFPVDNDWLKVPGTGAPSADATPATIDQSDAWKELLSHLNATNRGTLKAKAKGATDADLAKLCAVSAESRYRGVENQLYRVEIHRGGTVAGERPPTFKWSRDNGSVTFAIEPSGEHVVLKGLGRDDRLDLNVGDWVELLDDDSISEDPKPLRRVSKIAGNTVELSGSADVNKEKHPFLRRWDQKGVSEDGVVKITASLDWLKLEDGIEIQFDDGHYRPGDYWLIPARVETGDIDWPGPVDDPSPQRPRGVTHHYAPLARVVLNDGEIEEVTDYRRFIEPPLIP